MKRFITNPAMFVRIMVALPLVWLTGHHTTLRVSRCSVRRGAYTGMNELASRRIPRCYVAGDSSVDYALRNDPIPDFRSRHVFLLRGKAGARTELSLSLMAYNLNRRANVLGTAHLTRALQKTDSSEPCPLGSQRAQVSGQ